jgi:chromosome segregation ATPase
MKPPEPRLTRILWGLHATDVDEALQTLAEEHLVQMEVAHRRIDTLRVEEANWGLSINRLEERMATLRESLEALEKGRELAASYAERQLQLVAAELAERDRFHQEQLAALRETERELQAAIAEERAALGALARRLAAALEPPTTNRPSQDWASLAAVAADEE